MRVSLIAVQEAIRRGKMEGLVRDEPYRDRGAPEPPSPEEMEEFSYLRSVFEEPVACFAAKPRSEAKLVDFGRRWTRGERRPAIGPEGGRP